MSCKHNRWDRQWLISSVQIEWQNVAQMIKSQEGGGGSGTETEKVCVFCPAHLTASCTPDSTQDRKHFYFTHQSVASCRLLVSSLCYQTQITEISCLVSWAHVCGRALSLITGFLTGRSEKKNANNITHASHILEIFYFFFPPVRLSSQTGLCF